jgi:hypothetical protein
VWHGWGGGGSRAAHLQMRSRRGAGGQNYKTEPYWFSFGLLLSSRMKSGVLWGCSPPSCGNLDCGV